MPKGILRLRYNSGLILFPAGIRVDVEERGVFQLEHRRHRQQAGVEWRLAARDGILKAFETCAYRFHNPGSTQVGGADARAFLALAFSLFTAHRPDW